MVQLVARNIDLLRYRFESGTLSSFYFSLTPSQTLYLTMLMTNDFFYAQEAKKYEKG